MKPWVAYSLIRIGTFVLVFTVLMLVQVWWWVAAITATVLSFTIAYVFFGKLRDAVHRDAQQRIEGGPPVDPDADVEDALER